MDQFVIRAYGFNELARLYFPDVSPRSASNRLGVWIRTNNRLRNALADSGFLPGQKVFSPKQVQLITSELGPPYDELNH